MIEKFNPSKQTPLSTGHVQSHTMLPTEVSKLQSRISELDVENKKLNRILFHRENGLSHPDLQYEIDKSIIVELEQKLAETDACATALKNDNDQRVKLVNELEAELENCHTHETELNQDIKDLKDVVEPQKERISKLEKTLHQERNKWHKVINDQQAELATAKAALAQMRNENSAIRLRNEAVEEMMICYRIGKKPTEELFDKLDSSKKMLTAALTPPAGKWGHDADKCETFSEACLHHIAEYNERPCSDCPLPTPEGKTECKTCGGSGQVVFQEAYRRGAKIPCPVCNPDSTDKGKNDGSQ